LVMQNYSMTSHLSSWKQYRELSAAIGIVNKRDNVFREPWPQTSPLYESMAVSNKYAQIG
jgi:hypothetical protein